MLPLFIALLHGLPAIIGSFIARSTGIWIGAAVGVVAAFIWGRSFFLYSDLMGVCAGVLAAYYVMTKRDELKALREKKNA